MELLPTDFRLLHFRSGDVPAEKRLAAWRDVLSKMLLKVDVETFSHQSFHVDASLRALPGIRFGIGLWGPSITKRTAKIVAADNDDFYVLINTEGQLVLLQDGGEATLEEGDACLFSCSQQVAFVRNAPGRLTFARFERAQLLALIPDIDDCNGQIIRSNNEALRLFNTYLKGFDEKQSLAASELRRLAVTHIYDLFAYVLSSARTGLQAKRSDGIGTIRMRAIKKYIADNLHNQDLLIADVIAASRLSRRQVQRLFETEGITFSEFVVAQRLQKAHSALTDTRQSHRTISEIALSSGFGDVSYFNRAFRSHYGVAPSAVRQSAT